jgi:hypothetical protein
MQEKNLKRRTSAIAEVSLSGIKNHFNPFREKVNTNGENFFKKFPFIGKFSGIDHKKRPRVMQGLSFSYRIQTFITLPLLRRPSCRL